MQVLPPNLKINNSSNGIYEFQGVYTERVVRRLTQGRFSEVFDSYCMLDEHLRLGGQPRYTTRLRTYISFYLSELVLSLGVTGSFVYCGVSWGTMPLVNSEILKDKLDSRKWIFIDPMKNQGSHLAFCDNPQIVLQRWNNRADLQWHYEYLSSALVKNIPHSFAFVNLNTGDAEAELEALPAIWQKLSPGGIILHNYGLQPQELQVKIDTCIDRLGAISWQQMTGQLAIMKPAHGKGEREPLHDTIVVF